MRIIHVFRAPVGGLFRHVIDLASEQARRGHQVGVFCDATFAGDRNEKLLAELTPKLALGVERSPMQRNPHWTDLTAIARMGAFARRTGADVIHGHGAKGGLYARIGAVIRASGPIRAYTPHGGSLNYRPGSLMHRTYMRVEYLLEKGTDLFLFESRFVAERFREFVCETTATTRIVLNGLHPHELVPIEPRPDAADFLYMGEFRFAKGIDNMIAAMAQLKAQSVQPPTLVLVGQGPDEVALKEQVGDLGMADLVTFHKPMAARDAFSLGRTMIVPSRFESMPYVVIEAAGARVPMISTDVGGIPEVFGNDRDRLIPADNIPALTLAMKAAISSTPADRREQAEQLAVHIDENFLVEKMASTVLEAYEAARGARSGIRVAQDPRDLGRKAG
jgi:glycosyltransferase involved in cell wall biosynthesis